MNFCSPSVRGSIPSFLQSFQFPFIYSCSIRIFSIEAIFLDSNINEEYHIKPFHTFRRIYSRSNGRRIFTRVWRNLVIGKFLKSHSSFTRPTTLRRNFSTSEVFLFTLLNSFNGDKIAVLVDTFFFLEISPENKGALKISRNCKTT